MRDDNGELMADARQFTGDLVARKWACSKHVVLISLCCFAPIQAPTSDFCFYQCLRVAASMPPKRKQDNAPEPPPPEHPMTRRASAQRKTPARAVKTANDLAKKVVQRNGRRPTTAKQPAKSSANKGKKKSAPKKSAPKKSVGSADASGSDDDEPISVDGEGNHEETGTADVRASSVVSGNNSGLPRFKSRTRQK